MDTKLALRRHLTRLWLASCLATSPLLWADESVVPVQPVGHLDLPRYLGTWYEWAKYPNWFQRHCAWGTRAEYRMGSADEVRVRNSCRRQDGGVLDVEGVARREGALDSATFWRR